MAQKTAKRHYISAILSAIGQPQGLVWHIPIYKKAQKKVSKIYWTLKLLTSVNEHFEGNTDAQRALLDKSSLSLEIV